MNFDPIRVNAGNNIDRLSRDLCIRIGRQLPLKIHQRIENGWEFRFSRRSVSLAYFGLNSSLSVLD
jgi:hypothetical protein